MKLIIKMTLIELLVTFFIVLVAWLWAKKYNYYCVIDAVWSLSFSLHALIFYSLAQGDHLKKTILLSMLGLWSLRLGFYLSKRIKGHYPVEDTRYLKLTADYKQLSEKNYSLYYLRFFFYQAISISILTLPFSFAFSSSKVMGIS